VGIYGLPQNLATPFFGNRHLFYKKLDFPLFSYACILNVLRGLHLPQFYCPGSWPKTRFSDLYTDSDARLAEIPAVQTGESASMPANPVADSPDKADSNSGFVHFRPDFFGIARAGAPLSATNPKHLALFARP